MTEDGLDEKVLVRSDGTSVYMTQDIGTAMQRFEDFPEMKGMIYTVGNEQEYHFKTLFLILKKLGIKWTNMLYHLSYGMVDLPDGKMKSQGRKCSRCRRFNVKNENLPQSKYQVNLEGLKDIQKAKKMIFTKKLVLEL